MSTESAASTSAIRCKSCVHGGASPTGPKNPIAALHSPPISDKGLRKWIPSMQGGETRGLERDRARRSADVCDKFRRLELRGAGQGDRIDDGQMTVGGEHIHYAHLLVDQGVGLVNDAERRLTPVHERQRRADTVRSHQTTCDFV